MTPLWYFEHVLNNWIEHYPIINIVDTYILKEIKGNFDIFLCKKTQFNRGGLIPHIRIPMLYCENNTAITFGIAIKRCCILGNYNVPDHKLLPVIEWIEQRRKKLLDYWYDVEGDMNFDIPDDCNWNDFYRFI